MRTFVFLFIAGGCPTASTKPSTTEDSGNPTSDSQTETDADTDADADTDTDTDTDADTDTDTDADTDADTDTDPPLSYAADVAPILEAKCDGCHYMPVGMPDGQFAFQDEGDLVNVPSNQSSLDYVEPGSPPDSYLYRKIDGTQVAAGGSGVKMPATGSLTNTEKVTIRDWIADGALP